MQSFVMKQTDKAMKQFVDSPAKPLLDAFKFDCEVRNLTPKTIDVYFERLRYMLEYLNGNGIALQDVDKRTVQGYIMSMKDNVSDETTNGRVRACRRFFNFLCDEGLWEGPNPMKDIKLLKTAKRVKPVVEVDDLQRILSNIGNRTFENNRNRVMILIPWDCMLRKNELLGLKVSDIDLDARLIKVFGKGRKERMVPMGLKTLKALHQYLIKWRVKFPGEYVICMRDGEPIKERHCNKIMQDVGEKAGVSLYPHLLRHSAATWYIRQGGNPVVLQQIMGHTSLLVTQNYLHLSSKDAVSSYQRFSPGDGLRF